MPRQASGSDRLRALAWFVWAAVYAVVAHQLAARAAALLAPGAFTVVSRLFLVTLLLIGFAAMSAGGQRQRAPIAAIGLPRRPGAGREWLLGTALGWAGAVACVLPIALFSRMYPKLGEGGWRSAGALLSTLLALAAASLADELLFRGYPFQRLMAAVGPASATLVMTVFFVFARTGSFRTAGGIVSAVLLSFLLTMAYLRTRALWVGWGFHFAWNAVLAVLFGLPLSGSTEFAPIFTTYTIGPPALTGGSYGPEGSAVAVLVLLGLLFAMSRATRDLRHRWALPEITGAGIPVDIDALSRQQHTEGMGISVEAAPQLVQILPAERKPHE